MMDWPEVNCLIEALDTLVEKYRIALATAGLSEDEHSDLSNDLTYAEILRGKYEAIRSELART